MDAASLEEFKQIFERFTKVADEASGAAADAAEAEAEAAAAAAEAAKAASRKKAAADAGGGAETDDSDDEESGPRLSRKARKLKSRLSVAELKQLVQRPDVVEAHDVTAADPRMLVFLKVGLGGGAGEGSEECAGVDRLALVWLRGSEGRGDGVRVGRLAFAWFFVCVPNLVD